MRADIEIQANEILHHKLTLNGYLAEFTGQSMDTITQVRPFYFLPSGVAGKYKLLMRGRAKQSMNRGPLMNSLWSTAQ